MQSQWHNNPKFWLGVMAVLGGCLFLSYFLAVWSLLGLTLISVLLLGAVFFFSSPKWWWVPVPASFAAGGVLYFGFKLYLHEIMLLVCSLPLFFAVALRYRSFYQFRKLLPWTYYVLGIFLCTHMGWSLFMARISGEGGTGNIIRHYSWALWPMIFGFLYVWFGSTRYLKLALGLVLGAYLLRVTVTILTDYFGGFFYVPFINYVLPGSTPGETDDLRNSGLGLAAFTMIFFMLADNWRSRAFYFALLGLGGIALLLGGGRVAIAMGLLLPAIAAVASRRFTLIAGAAAAAVLFISALNLNPALLDRMDNRIQRTLSILVLEKGAVQAHADTAMSNYWHERLRDVALERWLHDTFSFFIGNRVKKFDTELLYIYGQQEWSFERAVEQAADVGAYEAGWFTVLANTGVIGLFCYLALLIQLGYSALVFVIRNGVKSLEGATSFIALYYSFMWLLFGWTFGAYPSFEIMLLLVANVAIYDRNRQLGQQPVPSQVETPAIVTATVTA